VKLAGPEGTPQPALALQGWVTREAGEKLLALAGKTVDELLAASEKRDFPADSAGNPHPRQHARRIRDLDTRNVAAMVPGSDPKLKDEVVGLQRGIGTTWESARPSTAMPSTTAPSTTPPAAPY